MDRIEKGPLFNASSDSLLWSFLMKHNFANVTSSTFWQGQPSRNSYRLWHIIQTCSQHSRPSIILLSPTFTRLSPPITCGLFSSGISLLTPLGVFLPSLLSPSLLISHFFPTVGQLKSHSLQKVFPETLHFSMTTSSFLTPSLELEVTDQLTK